MVARGSNGTPERESNEATAGPTVGGLSPDVTRSADPDVRAALPGDAAAIAGLLGFLGLVVPHVVRMAAGSSSHVFVVPISAVTGAALLLAGDTLARTVRAPLEMPVGPFMVMIGVPIFLWLLRKTVA